VEGCPHRGASQPSAGQLGGKRGRESRPQRSALACSTLVRGVGWQMFLKPEGKRKSWHTNGTPNRHTRTKREEKWRDGANHAAGKPNGAKAQGASESSTGRSSNSGACSRAPAGWNRKQAG